jgi:hypothetical protein
VLVPEQFQYERSTRKSSYVRASEDKNVQKRLVLICQLLWVTTVRLRVTRVLHGCRVMHFLARRGRYRWKKEKKAVIGSYGSISINLTEFTFLCEWTKFGTIFSHFNLEFALVVFHDFFAKFHPILKPWYGLLMDTHVSRKSVQPSKILVVGTISAQLVVNVIPTEYVLTQRSIG